LRRLSRVPIPHPRDIITISSLRIITNSPHIAATTRHTQHYTSTTVQGKMYTMIRMWYINAKSTVAVYPVTRKTAQEKENLIVVSISSFYNILCLIRVRDIKNRCRPKCLYTLYRITCGEKSLRSPPHTDVSFHISTEFISTLCRQHSLSHVPAEMV